MLMKPLKYAGIGPRQCPIDVCESMAHVARQLAEQNWWLRSGHAQGADQAWEIGHGPKNREIYLPWQSFNNPFHYGANEGYYISPHTPAIEAVAKIVHPAWHRLNQGGQKLMMRNVSIILGHELDDQVQFVAYWSPDRKVQGGTGNAIRLTSLYGIPSFNIAFQEDQEEMSQFIDALHQQGASTAG